MKKTEHQSSPNTPWYKQFWPWFLIALPGTVVIASIATFIIAASDPDAVVADNYYKEGLAINQDLSRLELARKSGLQATLQISKDKQKFRIYLKMPDNIMPDEISLRILHPTQVKKDQSLLLKKLSPGIYSGTGRTLSSGEWDIIIETGTTGWRVQKRINISDDISSYLLTDKTKS